MRSALLCLFLSVLPAGSQKADPSPYFERGERALAQGHYDEAQAAYEKLRQLDPSIPEVWGRLGLIYFQEKKFAQTVPALRQALKLKPSLPNTEVLLAMSLSELGRYSEALPGLEKGFHRTPDAALKRMAGLQLQRTYTALQKDSKAVEVALELVRLYPEDPEVLYHTGRLFGNFAYLNMRKLSEVAPDSVWRHQAAGEAHESQGDYDVAIMEYRAVLAREPARHGVHYRIGRSLLARGETPEASKEFAAELQCDPSNANAAYELAEIDRKQGQFDEAVKLFAIATQDDGNFTDAEIGLGRALTGQGKAEEALPHLLKAVALDASNQVSYYHLARAYGKLGETEEQRKALAEYQRLRDRRAASPAQEVTKQMADE